MFAFGDETASKCTHADPRPCKIQVSIITVAQQSLRLLRGVVALLAGASAARDLRMAMAAHYCQQALYSQNFVSYHVQWLGVFTEAYPILMIVLFPLIAISLRSNMLDMFFLIKQTCVTCARRRQVQDTQLATPPPIDKRKTKGRVAVATFCAIV
jgi:hypothetical protein